MWHHKCGCGAWVSQKQLSALNGVCPSCHKKEFILLTKAENAALEKARELGDWFVSRDIKCQGKVISQLVEKGVLEEHSASGGPYEYRAI